MSFFAILVRSLQRHQLSAALALLSVGLGAALVVAVVSFREQSHRQFRTDGLGVDAILAPKGSALQVVLNALYHLDEMPGTVSWKEYERIAQDARVTAAFPFVTGHSYGGYRVNAVPASFLSDFQVRAGQHFSFSQGGRGRPFAAGREIVAGATAARALGLTLNQELHVLHGTRAGDPAHEEDALKLVGILAPTGTPHDRALYMPLEAFYQLGGHPREVRRMAEDAAQREISGAYLQLRRIRGGAMHPGVRDLKYAIDRSAGLQLVVPNEVMPQLLGIVGWADRVLFLVGLLVVGLGGTFLFVTLVNALREQRRDLALLRMLGAGRKTVFGLVLSEALLLSFGSAVLGLALGHGLIAVGSRYILTETGLRFSALYASSADRWMVPAMLLLGAIAGMLPAFQAYRMSVLKSLNASP